MPHASRSPLRGYAFVPLFVGGALLVRLALWPVLGAEIPFLLLWPAVFLVAWYGGLGPGLLATALAVLADDYFFIQPGTLLTGKPAELAGLVLFALVGSLTSLLADRLQRANRLVEEHRERLRRRAEELAEADRRKDEFLAMLGHELRNPLAPLRDAARVLLQRTPTDRELHQAAAVIDRQAGHLARLVADLLDVSRTVHGKIKLHKEVVELGEVVEMAVEISRPVIQDRLHELAESLPREPVWLEADPTRLAQVIANLLNNAAKYTDERGRITLSAAREGREVVVRVRDNGVGLAADMLPRVFDLFTQGGGTRDRSQGGLGIGLTLVKTLVEMHGGTVAAFSEGPGKGSEFMVRLPALEGPARPAREGARDTGERAGTTGRRILVVDDNADAARVLALLLETQGYEVRTAGDGPSALEVAERFRPAVVLLDIGLPGMDGCEVARRLRGEAWGAGVLLVALTGHGREEDRLRSREAGFDHHLVKPVDPGDVQALLAAPRLPGSAPTRAEAS